MTEQRSGSSLSIREPLQERFGVSDRQWLYLSSVFIILSYVLFVVVYFWTNLPETPFLLVTFAYSILLIYYTQTSMNPLKYE